MKSFFQSLKDGYRHITETTDKAQLASLRKEGVLIDSDGYWSYGFGEHKEYELCVEPIGEEGEFAVSLYKNRVLLTQKLPIWTKKVDE